MKSTFVAAILIIAVKGISACSAGSCEETGCLELDGGGIPAFEEMVSQCVGKAELSACSTSFITAGICASKNGQNMCVTECVSALDSCEQGVCLFVGSTMDRSYIGCMPEAGDQAAGKPCTYPTDCILGSQCVEFAGKPKCCYVACSEEKLCLGATCTDTGFGFSVCVEGL